MEKQNTMNIYPGAADNLEFFISPEFNYFWATENTFLQQLMEQWTHPRWL